MVEQAGEEEAPSSVVVSYCGQETLAAGSSLGGCYQRCRACLDRPMYRRSEAAKVKYEMWLYFWDDTVDSAGGAEELERRAAGVHKKCWRFSEVLGAGTPLAWNNSTSSIPPRLGWNILGAKKARSVNQELLKLTYAEFSDTVGTPLAAQARTTWRDGPPGSLIDAMLLGAKPAAKKPHSAASEELDHSHAEATAPARPVPKTAAKQRAKPFAHVQAAPSRSDLIDGERVLSMQTTPTDTAELLEPDRIACEGSAQNQEPREPGLYPTLVDSQGGASDFEHGLEPKRRKVVTGELAPPLVLLQGSWSCQKPSGKEEYTVTGRTVSRLRYGSWSKFVDILSWEGTTQRVLWGKEGSYFLQGSKDAEEKWTLEGLAEGRVTWHPSDPKRKPFKWLR
mmetsp:Transcript_42994/g.96730  ORF Transcript_42994/g.96730 Transcript_42994/m.96730 type:complete len:394 (-) Transcript_42994:2-1183(-)